MEEFIDQYFEPIRNMFFEVGIKNVTMNDICSELGISKRTLYQKFKDKNQLVNEVFSKDLYNFKESIKSIQSISPNAIYETYLLFKLISKKQKKISATTLYDLKRYYAIRNEISIVANQLTTQVFEKNITRGINEKVYRKEISPTETANILTFFFNSFILKILLTPQILSLPLNSFLEYHHNSVCTQQGKTIWEKLKAKYPDA